jgi:ParB family chromosome partitioning protein
MNQPSAKKRRSALGTGLAALLPDRLDGDYFLCPIEQIRPSPHQPRQHFPEEAIEELAQSIREKGLIQPVILRRAGSEGYELIAGERRWRAAQRAGIPDIPAIVREASDEELLELALVENLQREDLNPVEEAQAYRALLHRTGATQDALSSRLGKSRAAIANALRLLSLPPQALDALRSARITPGHARAILALDQEDERLRLLDEILAKGLSVREAEDRSRARRPKAPRTPLRRDPNIRTIEERLSRSLGTRVSLQPGRKKGAGRLSIEYRSLDDLDRILDLLKASQSR